MSAAVGRVAGRQMAGSGGPVCRGQLKAVSDRVRGTTSGRSKPYAETPTILSRRITWPIACKRPVCCHRFRPATLVRAGNPSRSVLQSWATPRNNLGRLQSVENRVFPRKCAENRGLRDTSSALPLGDAKFRQRLKLARARSCRPRGVVVQLVRIPACHAGGRGFESRPLRQAHPKPLHG